MKIYKMVTDIAKSYEGVREGSKEHQQLVDDYNSILPHPRGYKLKESDSWCAAWVSVVMLRSGISTFPYECGVYEMWKALFLRGNLIRGRLPQPGELVLYKYSHVGIVLGSNPDDGLIVVIEGNSNNKVRIRNIYFNDKTIKCFASPITYTLTDVCNQVISGWWGNGEERRRSLDQGGYDYFQIQSGVNKIMGVENGLDKREFLPKP